MADAMATLLRLRRLQADEARRALGQAVTFEAEAQLRADQAWDERRREAGAAPPGTALAGAYAAWLPRSARDIAQAEAEATRCGADRAASAAALVDRRAALRAAETLLDERARLAHRAAGRRTQMKLDEAGRRPVSV